MKFKIVLFIFIFLSSVLFSQFQIHILGPKNGEYRNTTNVSFEFYVTNTTPLEKLEEQNITYDNFECLLIIQSNMRYKKFGPLNLPLNQKGEFEFTNVTYNTYIWNIQCNNISSQPYVLIIGNQTYEEFVNELLKQNQNTTQTNTINNTTINTSNNGNLTDITNKSNQNKENQTFNTNKNNLDKNGLEKLDSGLIIILLGSLFCLFAIIYFLFLKKSKKEN
jgi:hypothetical protein